MNIPDLRSISIPQVKKAPDSKDEWKKKRKNDQEARYCMKKEENPPIRDPMTRFLDWAFNYPQFSQFAHQNCEDLIENIKDCEVKQENLIKIWRELTSNDELLQCKNDIETRGIEKAIEDCADKWKKLRNLPFFQLIRTLWLMEKLNESIFEEITKQYT